jgi:hypothetical protein
MVLSVSQMTRARGISSAYRAFLEMSFEDVAAGKGVFTEMALIRSFASMPEQMPL